MSSKKLLNIQAACSSFERCRNLLVAALHQNEPRQCLDAFVELCSLHLEQTGGTLITARYRGELTALRALVAERPALTLLQPKEPNMPKLEPLEINVAVLCLFCQSPGLLTINGGHEYYCRCSYCFDGDPEAHGRSACHGTSTSAEGAVAAWHESMEAEHPTWLYTNEHDWQIALEAKRQAGWVETVTDEGIWIAPEILAAE